MISEILPTDDDSLMTVCDVIWQLNVLNVSWKSEHWAEREKRTDETDDPEEEDRPLLGAWVCTLNPDPDAPVTNSGAKNDLHRY